MNRFSIGQAWSYSTSFFSSAMANHAIALIGIGIFIPLVLQWVIIGNPMSSAFNPAAMASGGMMAGMGASVLVMSLISYILQFGSYFTSWRLGLGPDGNDLAGGLRFGMIAAAVFVGLLIVTLILMGLSAYAVSPWLALPFGLVLMLFFVVMYPGLFGFLAIMFLLLAVLGSYMGPMAMLTGGGGTAMVILLVVGAGLLWLAARLCCTAPSMADKNEALPFEAMKRSFAMTAEGQWRIVGYFLLIGVVLFVLAIILGLIVGSSFQSMMMGGGAPGIGTILILTILVSIPMAYFTVAIPGGIYRSLGQEGAGEVFA